MKAGWIRTTLDDICIVDWGNTQLTKSAYVEDGSFLAVSASGCDGRIGHKEHAKFTPVLSAIGAQCGKMFLPEEDFTAIKNTITLTPRESVCTGRFLFQLLSHIDLPKRGAAQPFISKGDIKAFQVSIPTSLTEQQRIVDILDEAFEAIAVARANAEQNRQNARALFESYLQSVFSQRGDGWVERTVGELVDAGVLFKPFDGNHGEIHPRKTDYVLSGVPFIMACDLQNGGVDTEGCKFIPRNLADSLRVGFAKDGDVLVSHKGTIGRSAVVNTELDYIMLTPQVTSYRIKDATKLSNRFVRYYFMSPVFQNEIIAGAADGATRAYIGITKQLSLHFRFPSLQEQMQIVERLDALDPETQRLEALYQRKIAALDELKQSLLQQAFSGQL